MALWEQVLLGLMGFAILFFFWPGAKKAIEQSRQAENKDWKAALIPISVVVLFVILLMMMARS